MEEKLQDIALIWENFKIDKNWYVGNSGDDYTWHETEGHTPSEAVSIAYKMLGFE